MRDADVASRFCSRYHSSMTYHPEKKSEVPTLSHGYPRGTHVCQQRISVLR